jgi:hypothetical protein
MSTQKQDLPRPIKAPTPADGQFHLISQITPQILFRWRKKSVQITEDDKFLIENYVASLARGNISIGRLNKIMFHLVGSRRFIGVFRTNTNDDLTGIINRLKNDEIRTIASVTKPAHPYNQNTKRDFVSIVKKFYLWMVKNNHSSILRRMLWRSKCHLMTR